MSFLLQVLHVQGQVRSKQTGNVVQKVLQYTPTLFGGSRLQSQMPEMKRYFWPLVQVFHNKAGSVLIRVLLHNKPAECVALPVKQILRFALLYFLLSALLNVTTESLMHPSQVNSIRMVQKLRGTSPRPFRHVPSR